MEAGVFQRGSGYAVSARSRQDSSDVTDIHKCAYNKLLLVMPNIENGRNCRGFDQAVVVDVVIDVGKRVVRDRCPLPGDAGSIDFRREIAEAVKSTRKENDHKVDGDRSDSR